MTIKTSSGQVLVEWLIGSVVIFIFAFGSVQVLRAKWFRLQCAVLTFKQTHEVLFSNGVHFSENVSVTQNAGGVKGQGLCDGALETVELKRLDDLDTLF